MIEPRQVGPVERNARLIAWLLRREGPMTIRQVRRAFGWEWSELRTLKALHEGEVRGLIRRNGRKYEAINQEKLRKQERMTRILARERQLRTVLVEEGPKTLSELQFAIGFSATDDELRAALRRGIRLGRIRFNSGRYEVVA